MDNIHRVMLYIGYAPGVFHLSITDFKVVLSMSSHWQNLTLNHIAAIDLVNKGCACCRISYQIYPQLEECATVPCDNVTFFCQEF